MKRTFHLLCSSIIAITLNSCSTAQDTKNVAADVCDCFKSLEVSLSPRMQKILLQANDAVSLMNLMEEYSMDDPAAMEKDAEYLGSFEDENGEIATCMNNLEKKYSTLYIGDSEEEMLKKIINELEKSNTCALASSVLKLGLQAMEGEYDMNSLDIDYEELDYYDSNSFIGDSVDSEYYEESDDDSIE